MKWKLNKKKWEETVQLIMQDKERGGEGYTLGELSSRGLSQRDTKNENQ